MRWLNDSCPKTAPIVPPRQRPRPQRHDSDLIAFIRASAFSRRDIKHFRAPWKARPGGLRLITRCALPNRDSRGLLALTLLLFSGLSLRALFVFNVLMSPRLIDSTLRAFCPVNCHLWRWEARTVFGKLQLPVTFRDANGRGDVLTCEINRYYSLDDCSLSYSDS